MAKNKQLISSYVVADTAGEEISTIERPIKFPETISFPRISAKCIMQYVII